MNGCGSEFPVVQTPYFPRESDGGVTVHNEMTEIQGGEPGNYHHVTSLERTQINTNAAGVLALQNSKADVTTVLLRDNTDIFTPISDYHPATKKYVDNSVPDISGKADITTVLLRDNSDIFTPTADYHPATKKYVDDNSGGSDGMNVAVISADATLTPGTDNVYQWLNATDNVILTLSDTAAVGDRFVIAHTGSYSSNRSIAIARTSTAQIDVIYAGGKKTFLYDGSAWIAGDTETGDMNDGGISHNISIGSKAKGYGGGNSIGYNSNGSDSGAATGDSSNGSYNGAAFGSGAAGFSFGSAIGKDANGYSEGAAVGNGANGATKGAGVGRLSDGQDNGAAVGYTSSGRTYGAAMGRQATAHTYGAAVGYGAVGSDYGAAVGQGSTASDHTVAMGYYARSPNICDRMWSNGDDGGVNKSGKGLRISSELTTDENTIPLLDIKGQSTNFKVPAYSAIHCETTVVAFSEEEQVFKTWKLSFAVMNYDVLGVDFPVMGTINKEVLYESTANSWDVTATFDATITNAIQIKVNGAAGETVRWTATTEYTLARIQ